MFREKRKWRQKEGTDGLSMILEQLAQTEKRVSKYYDHQWKPLNWKKQETGKECEDWMNVILV